MQNKIFVVLGGDRRQISVAARLAAFVQVRVFGLPLQALCDGITYYEDWRDAVSGADALLLPLPASQDGIRLSCPQMPELPSLSLAELLSALSPQTKVLGGRLTPAFKARAEALGIQTFDYCESEEFQLKNAIPTAEGAVEILMRESARTVRGMAVAITGFGRVARALSRLLLAMGAEVTVAARKASALQEAAALGCRTVLLKNSEALRGLCHEKHAIFNTVPHWIFTKEILRELPEHQLFIDLASAPGGMDPAIAAVGHVRVIYALSLPGKYAPETAGEIIAETVLSALEVVI